MRVPETEDDINLLKLTPNKLVVLEMGFSAFQIKSKREFTALDWNPFHDNDTIQYSSSILIIILSNNIQNKMKSNKLSIRMYMYQTQSKGSNFKILAQKT